MGFRHRFRVRYVDCDPQRVMHNANYLAYVDDAIDTWYRSALGDFESADVPFDFMVKKVTVEWYSPAFLGDEVDCECRVSRWGTTSLDVEIAGSVGDRRVFSASMVQVSTEPGHPRAVVIPDFVRAGLS
jgi:acyl-CoA thioester hydrolase